LDIGGLLRNQHTPRTTRKKEHRSDIQKDFKLKQQKGELIPNRAGYKAYTSTNFGGILPLNKFMYNLYYIHDILVYRSAWCR
jgi:hypothetical protein